MAYLDDMLQERLTEFYEKSRKLTVLTGAGLSADSGIPTFRDKDGFWTVGSINYMPDEMGTLEMFLSNPLEVWKWFLYRFNICFNALPNTGHFAIKEELEDIFIDRFRYFKFDSSLRVAKETGLLLIVGTSGATTLPQRIVESVLSRHGIIIDINPNENYFSELALKKKNGYWLKGKSSDLSLYLSSNQSTCGLK